MSRCWTWYWFMFYHPVIAMPPGRQAQPAHHAASVFSSQVVNLLLLSLALPCPQLSLQTEIWREGKAKNAKMIKCWLIAFTWMADNWAVRWRESLVIIHFIFSLHSLTDILAFFRGNTKSVGALLGRCTFCRYVFFDIGHFVIVIIGDMTDVIGFVLQWGYQV